MPNSLHRQHYQIFRSLIVDARLASGLTQVQIADRLGKPQSYVSKYERGERRLDFTEFVELADIIGINIPEFLLTYQSALKVNAPATPNPSAD